MLKLKHGMYMKKNKRLILLGIALLCTACDSIQAKNNTNETPLPINANASNRVLALGKLVPFGDVILVAQPKLVLADEPTASLDSKTGRDVVDIIQRLAKENCTVLLVTHDTRILDIADRIVNMEDGQLL